MGHELDARQQELCASTRTDFSDLRALFINCTLKRSPQTSNTEGLASLSMGIMDRLGVTVDLIRAVDHQIATGVQPDMTEHGWMHDDWPDIFKQVMAADILVLLTPIWLGEKSSVCTRVIERLYGNSHLLNDAGQWAYYGRVGGCIITGNEDGAKHCAMNHPLLAAAPGLLHPAAGRLCVAGRGRARPQLPGPRFRWAGERLHQSQHDVPDLEPAACRAHDQGRRRDPSARQPGRTVGGRLPLRRRQS
jgi:multimeric flavodoxin WrbA